MKSVTTHQAKTQLSKLLAEVEAGEEVIILRGDKPVAKLSAIKVKARRTRPKVGTTTSAPIRGSPDAFAPLSEEELKQWGL
jgi:antitoxin (DNA-binding transcriptional repressor) of toxin-antitoxin stability system